MSPASGRGGTGGACEAGGAFATREVAREAGGAFATREVACDVARAA